MEHVNVVCDTILAYVACGGAALMILPKNILIGGLKMARLQNIQMVGKNKQIRVVLDSVTPDTNYIERTSGAFYDTIDDKHHCLKCLKPLEWNVWTKKNNAKTTCYCGNKATLSYQNFNGPAHSYSNSTLLYLAVV